MGFSFVWCRIFFFADDQMENLTYDTRIRFLHCLSQHIHPVCTQRVMPSAACLTIIPIHCPLCAAFLIHQNFTPHNNYFKDLNTQCNIKCTHWLHHIHLVASLKSTPSLTVVDLHHSVYWLTILVDLVMQNGLLLIIKSCFRLKSHIRVFLPAGMIFQVSTHMIQALLLFFFCVCIKIMLLRSL